MRNKTQQKVVFSTINVCICSAVYSTFYVGTFLLHGTWAAKNLGFSHRVSVVVIKPGNRATLRTYFYYCTIVGLMPVIP